jgi:hypothetical protein
MLRKRYIVRSTSILARALGILEERMRALLFPRVFRLKNFRQKLFSLFLNFAPYGSPSSPSPAGGRGSPRGAWGGSRGDAGNPVRGVLTSLLVKQCLYTCIMRLDCDNCGKETPHTQCGEALEHEVVDTGDDYPPLEVQWTHTLAQCDVCNNVSLYVSDDFNPEEFSQLYPAKKNLDDVPEEIRNSYVEARKVRGASPVAFVVMAGRTLEYICKDKNASGKDLKQKLDDLSAKDIIPKTLAEMSHVLRDQRNKGAHAVDEKITTYDARTVNDFLLAVIEYVYIAPAKLAKIKQRTKEKNA